MSTTRSLMGSAKLLRLELSTTPGGVPDQTLNFGVGNMIDMRKSRHSGKKIYDFFGKPLGERGIWGELGVKLEKTPPRTPGVPPNLKKAQICPPTPLIWAPKIDFRRKLKIFMGFLRIIPPKALRVLEDVVRVR